jgi:hypothetical protein
MADCLAARTMAMSRSIADSSATEVPPNFMTIMSKRAPESWILRLG